MHFKCVSSISSTVWRRGLTPPDISALIEIGSGPVWRCRPHLSTLSGVWRRHDTGSCQAKALTTVLASSENYSSGQCSDRTSTWEEEKITTPRQMILSVSAATFYQKNKTGVVGLDVKVENILNKLVNLDKAGIYVVLVNNRGNVVYHPRLKPLPDLDYSYVARFAELEQCTDGTSSADIEQAAISGTEGMIEARCLYHFSLNSQRGREVFTQIQYYYTPLTGFPFYLILAVPTFFSHELQALQLELNQV
eukprot:sb/3468763/